MLKPRWYKVIRDLWHNRLRTFLVVLAIAIGVFTFGVVGISSSILKDELNTVYRATNPASIQMTVSPFDDQLLAAVRNMREVDEAEARAMLVVSLEIRPDEWINLRLYALDDFDAMHVSTFAPQSGQWPPGTRQVLIERAMYRIPGFEPGRYLNISLPDGRDEQLELVGSVHDVAQFPAHYFQQGLGYVTLDTYEWLTGSRAYNRLYIVVAKNADDKAAIEQTSVAIKERIELFGYTVLGADVPQPGEHWNGYAYDALVIILGVLSVFSLLLTLFLVFNTMSAILKQQVRQIGMMKAVGGRTPQIVAVYLAMVLVFGLLALALAIPSSSLIARYFVDFAATLTNFDILHYRVEPWVIELQALLAVLLPLIAALLPVLDGASITAREALSDYGLAAPTPDDLVDRLVNRVRGLSRPNLLSLRNTFRRRARLALTLVALTLAGGVFIAIFSLREAMQAKMDELFSLLDYDVAIILADGVPIQRLEREALRVDGVVYAEGWLYSEVQIERADGTEGAGFSVYGAPLGTRFIDPAVSAGRWLDGGQPDEIVVQGNLPAMEPDIGLGDTIHFDVDGRPTGWQIVGIMQYAQDPDGKAGFAYTTLDDLQRAMNLHGQANFVAVRTTRHDIDFQQHILRQVQEQYRRAGIGVQAAITGGQLVAGADIAIGTLLTLLLAMAFLLAVVGGLGLAGTMSLNVLERTREIGVMRSIGASNWSVFSIVIIEGVLIGLLSVLLGAILAIPLSRLLGILVGQILANEPLVFAYSFPGVGMWLALSVILSIISSYLPARSAARLSVRETLAYE